ncbi:MAG: trigger factor [Rhodobacteraceae bacterium]|nr:trigger factor [Paracoccaceae bacterium]
MVPTLGEFEGEWTVARRIVDRLGPEARFEGVARFSRAGTGLLYREEGELFVGGGQGFHAERSYFWHPGEGGRIAVDFGDGRAFHDFDPAEPAGRHHCGDDDYAVRYDFSHWPEWRAEWVVKGPRKDYTLTSRYRRR